MKENDNQDICPVNDNGRHRYFIYKVVDVYEQVDENRFIRKLVDNKKVTPFPLYEKIEYAISGCNCGSATKRKITGGSDF